MKPAREWERYRYVTDVEREMIVGYADDIHGGMADFADALCDVEHGGPVDIDGLIAARRVVSSAVARLYTVLASIEKSPVLVQSDWKRWQNANAVPLPAPASDLEEPPF